MFVKRVKMRKVLKEVTPLSEKDCFYIVERFKSEFLFPLHCHEEFELNFIEGGGGIHRIVGDSVEEIGNYELTLVANGELEHAWEQGNCTNPDVREITIQFSPQLFGKDLLSRTQFVSIREMLERATLGVNFSLSAVMKVYHWLDGLVGMTNRFDQFLKFLNILYELSKDEGSRTLASSVFARGGMDGDTDRLQKVKEYVASHYAEECRLNDVAELAGMTPSAFCRFFRQHTGRTFTEYIIDIRLGNAARLLVDSSLTIVEISYSCGFNNLSNFNRTFKAHKGYTPRDFRVLFKKNRVFI